MAKTEIDNIALIKQYKDRILNAWDKRELINLKHEVKDDSRLSLHWKTELDKIVQHKIDYMEV